MEESGTDLTILFEKSLVWAFSRFQPARSEFNFHNYWSATCREIGHRFPVILENSHYPGGRRNRALSRFCGGESLPHVAVLEFFDFWVVLVLHLLKAGSGITIPE